MRALRTVTLMIALAGASATSAHAETKKAAPLSSVDSEKLLAFFNELVDQAVKNANDCGALAAAVDGVVTRHINTVQMTWAAKKAKKTPPPEVQAQLEKRSTEMVNAIRKCLGDDRVKAAFARMKVPKDQK